MHAVMINLICQLMNILLKKNKDIEKDNIICNTLSNLYNKYTKLNTPLFNSLEDYQGNVFKRI